MRNTRTAVIFMALILLIAFQTGCNPPPSHVGQWIDSSLREAIVFHENGTFELLYYYHPDPALQPGQPVPQIPDDKTWKVKLRGKYAIDFSKNPAWIDLVVNEQGMQRRSEGLITFHSDNTFYAAFEDVRPASIDSSSRKVRFTRAAPNEIWPISK